MPEKSPKSILAYGHGPLPIGGAVTVEIIVPPCPLEPFIDMQYIDSKTMSRRPGMYMKYLPYLYSPTNGKLLTGGSYAFDTFENAKDYARWVMEDFTTGEEGNKTKFWDQPMFENCRSWVWQVLGAHAFTEVETHASMRLVQWKYTGHDAEQDLIQRFPTIKDEIEKLCGAAVWLLHNSEEHMIGLQIVFAKEAGKVDDSVAQNVLMLAGAQRPLEHLLPDGLSLECFYDRASLLLILWLPRSRMAGGTELYIPLLPMVVPDITYAYD